MNSYLDKLLKQIIIIKIKIKIMEVVHISTLEKDNIGQPINLENAQSTEGGLIITEVSNIPVAETEMSIRKKRK